ncbi:hypothetical protein PMI29_03846 [Pseudomonas sp. GM49]|nr:hypothetical protein PMI29_03846 [Pseudomonas sp. GM49]
MCGPWWVRSLRFHAPDLEGEHSEDTGHDTGNCIARHAFHTLTTLSKATANERGIEQVLRNNATGYEGQMHRKLLASLEEYLGDFEVDRHYKLITDERCKAGLCMQGFCQASHRRNAARTRLAPTFVLRTPVHCGSELARDGAMENTTNIES